MCVHRKPLSAGRTVRRSTLQRNRSSARPVERIAIFAEPRRGPRSDSPCRITVASAPDRIEVNDKVCDVGPDALPLVRLQRLESNNDVSLCAERGNVVGENAPARFVVNRCACRAQPGEPLPGGLQVVISDDWPLIAQTRSHNMPCSNSQSNPGDNLNRQSSNGHLAFSSSPHRFTQPRLSLNWHLELSINR